MYNNCNLTLTPLLSSINYLILHRQHCSSRMVLFRCFEYLRHFSPWHSSCIKEGYRFAQGKQYNSSSESCARMMYFIHPCFYEKNTNLSLRRPYLQPIQKLTSGSPRFGWQGSMVLCGVHISSSALSLSSLATFWKGTKMPLSLSTSGPALLWEYVLQSGSVCVILRQSRRPSKLEERLQVL